VSMESTLVDLTARWGQSITLVVTTGGTHALAGTVSGVTSTSMTVTALVRQVSAKMIDGQAILAGDLIVLVPIQAALTVVPKAGIAKTTIDSVLRICASDRTFRGGGVVAGYELVMRGAA